MILLLIILGVLALGLVAAALVQRTGVPGVPDPVTSQSFEGLPRAGVDADALIEVQFDQAVRGYRMSQVDDVLDRLAEELRDRDSEIAALRTELAAVPVDFTGHQGMPSATSELPTTTGPGDGGAGPDDGHL